MTIDSNNMEPRSDPIRSGQDGGNTGRQKIASELIGAGAEPIGSFIQGMTQVRENERAREEGREMADLQRSDDLQQQDILNSYKQRQFQQQQQQFALKQKKDEYDLKYQNWLEEFRAQLDRDAEIASSVSRLRENIKRGRVRKDLSRSLFR